MLTILVVIYYRLRMVFKHLFFKLNGDIKMKTKHINPIGFTYENGQLIRIYPNPKIKDQIKDALRDDWRVSCQRCKDDTLFLKRI